MRRYDDPPWWAKVALAVAVVAIAAGLYFVLSNATSWNSGEDKDSRTSRPVATLETTDIVLTATSLILATTG